jgi:hypothetical protein
MAVLCVALLLVAACAGDKGKSADAAAAAMQDAVAESVQSETFGTHEWNVSVYVIPLNAAVVSAAAALNSDPLVTQSATAGTRESMLKRYTSDGKRYFVVLVHWMCHTAVGCRPPPLLSLGNPQAEWFLYGLEKHQVTAYDHALDDNLHLRDWNTAYVAFDVTGDDADSFSLHIPEAAVGDPNANLFGTPHLDRESLAFPFRSGVLRAFKGDGPPGRPPGSSRAPSARAPAIPSGVLDVLNTIVKVVRIIVALLP